MELLTQNKWKIIGAVLFFVLGLAIGRYATPPEKITKIEIIEIEKKVYVEEKTKAESSKTYKHITEKTLPDGTIIKETVETDETNLYTENKVKSEEESVKSTSEEIFVGTQNKGRWLINGLAGIDVSRGMEGKLKAVMVYGIQVYYRILGPVHVGAWGTTTKELGLSAGLEF